MLNWYYRNMIYLLLSLPHFSVTIFISSQTNKAEGQVQNKSSLSLTHSSLSLSAASHFFFTRFGGQWVNDYISSSFFSFFLFFSRQIARFGMSCGLTVIRKVHRKTDIFGFVTLKNCFDERFTINPIGLYGPVRV